MLMVGLMTIILFGLLTVQRSYGQIRQTESTNQLKALNLSGGLGFGDLGFGYQLDFAANFRFGVIGLRHVSFHQMLVDPGDSVGDFAVMYGYKNQKNHSWGSLRGGLGLSQFIERECTEYANNGDSLFGNCKSHSSNFNWGVGMAFEGAIGYRLISLNLVGDINTVKSFWGLLLNFNINMSM